jgi:hypothetical protein
MAKVLIVDDDDALRNLMRVRLAGTYEVIDTGNPVQALGLALEHKPDAILLDLMMPNTSGFELKGQDEAGRSFEQLTTSENVSASGFLCNFAVALGKDAILDVSVSSAGQHCYVGKVRAARMEAPDTPWQRCGFQFVERSKDWILQDQLI